MTCKFLPLSLVLAKSRVAITWIGQMGPSVDRWIADVTEWVVAKKIRLKGCRRDDKFAMDLETWDELLEALCVESTTDHDPTLRNMSSEDAESELEVQDEI